MRLNLRPTPTTNRASTRTSVAFAAEVALQREIATATATSWTLWACAVEHALQTQIQTASATMWTIAWVNWMPVGCATVLAPSMNAVAQTSQTETATATATSWNLGVCGGTCTADADSDGICDDVDDCVGELDACGVCNGPGAVYVCGCSGIPEGDCDCNGNQLDALWWRVLRG